MEARQILDVLVGLAEEAGLRVRAGRGSAAPEGEPTPRSALCRVRGETWLVLLASDGVDERIRVVAEALRIHAADLLEERYLPPAVRERLEGPAAASGPEG
jgi:hypothetical protein